MGIPPQDQSIGSPQKRRQTLQGSMKRNGDVESSNPKLRKMSKEPNPKNEKTTKSKV